MKEQMSERPRTMTAEREAELRLRFSRPPYLVGEVLRELDAERAAHDSSEQQIIDLRLLLVDIEAHLEELRDAWERGSIHDIAGKGAI